MREAGILDSMQEGKWVIYSLTANPDSTLQCWIEEARKQISYLPKLISCSTKPYC
jgi:DNA-binding transcriptional ArsR family regulator